MKADQFCFWLQGLFELANPETLDAEQTAMIRKHLAMAFLHDIDKQAGADQPALNHLHGGKPGDLKMRC